MQKWNCGGTAERQKCRNSKNAETQKWLAEVQKFQKFSEIEKFQFRKCCVAHCRSANMEKCSASRRRMRRGKCIFRVLRAEIVGKQIGKRRKSNKAFPRFRRQPCREMHSMQQCIAGNARLLLPARKCRKLRFCYVFALLPADDIEYRNGRNFENYRKRRKRSNLLPKCRKAEIGERQKCSVAAERQKLQNAHC